MQQDSRRFISQETGSLYIAKVEPSDVGNYTCVVNNTITQKKVLSSPTPLLLRTDGKSCRPPPTEFFWRLESISGRWRSGKKTTEKQHENVKFMN